MGGVRELLFVDPCDGLLPCVCVREDRDFLFLCCSVSPFLQADGRALLSKAVRQERVTHRSAKQLLQEEEKESLCTK